MLRKRSLVDPVVMKFVSDTHLRVHESPKSMKVKMTEPFWKDYCLYKVFDGISGKKAPGTVVKIFSISLLAICMIANCISQKLCGMV